jgi:hypothetical protein
VGAVSPALGEDFEDVLALDVSKALFVADRGHDVNSFVLLLDKSPSLRPLVWSPFGVIDVDGYGDEVPVPIFFPAS